MTKEKIRFLILRTLGNFFILFSLYGMVMTFGPAVYYEVSYRMNSARNIRYVVASKPPPPDDQIPHQQEPGLSPTPANQQTIGKPTDWELSGGGKPDTFFGQLTGGNKVEVISPVSSQFGIIIPKIAANAAIFPNVDAGNADSYLKVLKNGVAHAAGTVFPGVKGNIYLFAHSTDNFWNVGRYNAIFYLLKELETGDEIDVFFQGVRHVYRVTNKSIVNPSETHYLTQALPYEQLTLQTCWPPGTTMKRLLIFAIPEAELAR